MKKSEFKQIIKECIGEVLREADLSGIKGSFANYLQDNLSKLEPYAKDAKKLESKLRTDMESLKISDKYKQKFFASLAKQRTPTARLMFLSNAMLKGSDLGAL